MKTYRLNPLIISKTETNRILLAFRDSTNSNIYEFSGIIMDLLIQVSTVKSFIQSDLMGKIPSDAKDDLQKFWDFCISEQIFIPIT